MKPLRLQDWIGDAPEVEATWMNLTEIRFDLGILGAVERLMVRRARSVYILQKSGWADLICGVFFCWRMLAENSAIS